MKYGFCLPRGFAMPNSAAAGTSHQLRSFLDGYRLMREIGYDYMECAVGHLVSLTDEEMEQAAACHRDGLLTVEACNSFIPGTLPLVGPQADWNAIESYLRNALSRMAQVGVKTVVFGSGAARKIPEGITLEEAMVDLDRFMTLAESIARPLDITVVIEPLNKGETNVIHTVAAGGEIARRLNLPNLKLLGDSYHMYLEGEDPNVLYENRDILKHIHVAEPVGRVNPKDGLYLRQCGEALKKAGYEGRVSIECNYRNFEEEIRVSFPFLQKLF